jgi:hypothetical protein
MPGGILPSRPSRRYPVDWAHTDGQRRSPIWRAFGGPGAPLSSLSNQFFLKAWKWRREARYAPPVDRRACGPPKRRRTTGQPGQRLTRCYCCKRWPDELGQSRDRVGHHQDDRGSMVTMPCCRHCADTRVARQATKRGPQLAVRCDVIEHPLVRPTFAERLDQGVVVVASVRHHDGQDHDADEPRTTSSSKGVKGADADTRQTGHRIEGQCGAR